MSALLVSRWKAKQNWRPIKFHMRNANTLVSLCHCISICICKNIYLLTKYFIELWTYCGHHHKGIKQLAKSEINLFRSTVKAKVCFLATNPFYSAHETLYKLVRRFTTYCIAFQVSSNFVTFHLVTFALGTDSYNTPLPKAYEASTIRLVTLINVSQIFGM